MNYKIVVSGTGTMLCLAAFIMFFMAGCNTQEVESYWISESIHIDGQRTEWNNIPVNYFEDEGVALGLCNDEENLYLFFSFKNPVWARAIRMGGLTLWLDAGGKKKKEFGICYIGGPTHEDLQKNHDLKLPDNFTERIKEHGNRLGYNTDRLAIINEKNKREVNIPVNSTDGPAVGYAKSKDIYTYEFRLPLTEGNLSQYDIGANPGDIVCIGAEWGDIDMGERKRPDGTGSMGMRGGRGGGGGGGKGGGLGRPGGGHRQPPEKQEIWIKTQLAAHQEKSEHTEQVSSESGR